jgi:hypothetical protein
MDQPRKRRVHQPGSDQEDDSQYDEEGTANIAQMIQFAHGSTRSQVKSVIEQKTNEIKSDMNDLKRDVQDSREAERYVSQKHSDQAGMLRVLNRRLNDMQEESSELKKQIMDLKHRLGRHDAFQDCVDMNGEILDLLKEGEILDLLREMKDDIKGIKKRLRTIE